MSPIPGAADSRPRPRPLQPAPARQPPRSPFVLGAMPPRKRNTVAAACIECRKHKSRCSGDRPECRRCVQRHLQCYYTTRPGETESHAVRERIRNLQDRSAIYEEVVELLKSLPHRESQDVLQKIRSGMDIKAILNRFETCDALLQMAVSPESRFRYTFPYKTEMPDDILADNPYLESVVYDTSTLFSRVPTSDHSDRVGAAERLPTLVSEQYQSLYLKPFHAAEVIEPRLTTANISAWTNVCDDNALMRRLLNNFLHCEYQFTAAFQKDLFLEDLAEKREEFCSSLLVNVVLGYSCVCYSKFSNRSEYWNPNTLLYRFIAEAKRLWELEATKPRITTVQAGIIFNVFHNLCGLDEIGQAYRLQALSLAHKLRLFDANVAGRSLRVCHGMAFAAWALYNWETLVGFSFAFPPLLKKPPEWPLPDATQGGLWYGEIWVKYPLSHHLVPQYFGQVIEARSRFRVIKNEACQIAFSEDLEMTIDKAHEILSKLKRWFEGLPNLLQPKAIVLPVQLQLHIYYYHLILTLYEPLVNVKTGPGPLPETVVADAQKQLQTLVRLYYLRHGFEAMDLFIVIPLMLAGSETVDVINEQTPAGPRLEKMRSTLMLVAKGLYDQRRNHYLAEALYRVIRGRMRPAEVALLRDTMDVDDKDPPEKRQMVQEVRSQWPVSVVRKKEDMESHVLKNLVESYAQLNVEDVPQAELSAKGGSR